MAINEQLDIDEAIEQADKLTDTPEPSAGLVGAVAADVERAFEELGRIAKQNPANQDTFRLATAVRETIAQGGSPTREQVEALQQAAGDILNEVQRRRTSEAERDAILEDENRDTSDFERRLNERRSKVNWARTSSPARRGQSYKPWEVGEALTEEKVKAEHFAAARKFARDKCMADGNSSRYHEYLNEAMENSKGSVLTGVALLGSETPSRVLPDTYFPNRST